VREVAFLVVTRPGHHYSTPPGATVYRLNTLAMPVSSSDIRASLAAGKNLASCRRPWRTTYGKMACTATGRTDRST